jgi:hypothetical protein
VTVYAKAWIEGGEEPYTSNNSESLFFDGLLTKYEEVTTMDTALLAGEGEGSYTVQADIRNNSMQQADLGSIIVDVLDSDNNLLESIKMQESPLTLSTEQSKSLTKTITVEDGTPASAKVRSSALSVVLDPNGGVCGETSASLTKYGTLSGMLPEATKTGYTFSGWFTEPSGGEKVTQETVFGGNGDSDQKVEPNEDGVYVVYAQFTGSSGRPIGGSDSSGKESAVTVPVTGDSGTVSVSVSVKDKDAAVSPLTAAQVDSIVGSGSGESTVEIDASGLGKEITTVTIPAETVKVIAAAASDPNKDAESLTVKLSAGENTNILSYADAQNVSQWAIPAMQWAVGSGLITGRTASTLNPTDNASRAEIATIMMRYCTETAK